MTAPLCLPARMAGTQAAGHFSRPGLANWLRGLTKGVRIAQTGAPDTRVPPFVERLWMPAYAIRLTVLARGKVGSVWAAVDAITGQVTLLESDDDLVPRELTEDCFPPALSEAAAIEAARENLLRYSLRRRGHRDKPVVQAVEEVRFFYHPFWVLYYRRGKALDLKVLDAYTGKEAGSKLRVAVVNALIAARKRKQASSAPSPDQSKPAAPDRSQ